MKPILFNTEMVKAILDGRKSVTRRKIKPQLMEFQNDKTEPWDSINHYRDNTFEFKCRNFTSFYPSPYQVGDILCVRETWCKNGDTYLYKAGNPHLQNNIHIKWKPSIHMPKEAARIFLKVTDVRVEKLQDITEEQAKNEGVRLPSTKANYANSFIALWNSTIKKQDIDKYGWEGNPWVWVIEFERIGKDEALSN